MSAHNIRRGFDIPLGERAEGTAIPSPPVKHVALLPQEVPGIKVRLLVKEGEDVKLGQALFLDKRDEGAPFGSPAGGTVVAIHRGERRAVLAIVIAIGDTEEQADIGELRWNTREDVAQSLRRAGLWTLLRERPFDRIPMADSQPAALFITGTDTHPLAASPRALIAGREDFFRAGLTALGKLAPRTVLCTSPEDDWSVATVEGVALESFSGPHPAGNVGTHLHFLEPVGAGKCAWHLSAQDVAAVGELVSSDKLPKDQVIAIGGPALSLGKPGLMRTRRGAATSEFLAGLLPHAPTRVVSGSVLTGATANADTPTGYLGSRAQQVVLLDDHPPRDFLGWTNPFFRRHTYANVAIGKFYRKRHDFDTDLNGGYRAIVPIGSWEEIMPLDILPTPLIRSLAACDLEAAEQLGTLELAEEDLALCEYVDPSKTPICSLLRNMLERIQKEG